MKRLSLFPLLALTTMAAHAATSVDLQASLQLKTPSCTISVTPENTAITAAYAVDQVNLDANTPGTYTFQVPAADYLVSTNESCPALPAVKFNMPTPAAVDGTYDKKATSHGVSWKTNSVLIDLVAHTLPDGTGTSRNMVGNLYYKASAGGMYTEGIARGIPTSYTTRADGTVYIPTQAPAVRHDDSGSWTNGKYGPVVASSATGTLNVITPTLTGTDASMTISLGALFDAKGPRVGNAYDQRAIVNGLDYGWAGTLIVTAI